jgi:hypothetical protein
MQVAAWVATVLLLTVAGFQIALAFGAPWGVAAWGGRNPGVLPTGYRVASGIVGFFFYPAVILILLDAAGALGEEICVNPCSLEAKPSNLGLWVLAGLFTVGAVMNFISPSKAERPWGVVALIIAGCCAVIAFGQ